jgi:hypothetical protein
LLVFHVFLDLVLIDLVKPLLVICAEREECLTHLKLGEDGTEELILNTKDTLYLQPLLLLLLLLSSWLEVTELQMFHKFH